MKIAEDKSPILLTGTGRCGTTVLAQILGRQPDFLYIEEPNFITHLFIPFLNGQLTKDLFISGLYKERWRGPMKFCRTMSEMYPSLFGDNGSLPIRPYMKKCMHEIVENSGRPSSQKRFIALNYMLIQIVARTCTVSGKAMWFVKQPSAIIFWRELRRFWPGMKIIHVTRRLEYIVQSRIKREYQANFHDALQICEDRLLAAAQAWETLPKEVFCNISIDDLVASPRDGIDTLFRFLDMVPVPAVIEAAKVLDKTMLSQLGEPSMFFQSNEQTILSNMRKEINGIFGKELV